MAGKVLVAICASAGLLWSTAFAGSVMVPGIGGDFQLKVTSFENRRFDSVMRQQYDFSCGSAALASLLSFHYDDPVTEHDVFIEMLALADEEKVRQQGFSMLDMKRYLEARGYQADGFRVPLTGLKEKVRLPMIVLLNIDGFQHFVLIKGISDGEVLVGDPARGLKVYSYAQFSEYWNGTAFVIRSHLQQGRDAFLGEGHWPQVARAPIQKVQGGPSLGHTLPYWPSTREW
ncbi:peptidase C39 [Marinobacter vulgaris]|uniref:Peptidase C39 n=1 Tax=Marinobacter vulgaris TaxID=1928331 RepID=A0A2V3ZS65_9GAMM|nr:C39 family peptidase [Marinobacter vulgaris]PXX93473.1 peptidase C39 [Marinobacter vulgaris]TSJ72514.1 C39 family peptidase [Marinobacter vulgaris]